MTASPESRNRRALLIGIDHYPLLPEHKQLKGAVNDAKTMAQTLIERFGFPEGDVRLLLDEAATRDAIFAALDRLVEETRTNDVVVFHFSGHGSQETIVPVDSGRAPSRDITEDEIYSWLVRLTEKTPYVTLIFDCCHSATIIRDAFGETVSGIEHGPETVRQLLPWADRLLGNLRPKGGGRWLPWHLCWTLFASCANDEESHELPTPGDGVRHGALTHFLVQELLKANPGDTYRDIFERVGPRVTAEFRHQQPQLEGVWDREVFGVRHFEPLRWVRVLGRHRDGRVLLGAGAVSGLTVGSQWEIHPPGARDAAPGSEQGLVEITGVCAFASDGRIVREARPGLVRRDCRALERCHSHGDMGWTVDLVIPGVWKEHVEILETGIRDSPLLRQASGSEAGSAHTRVYLLGPRRGVRPGDPAPMLENLEEPFWVAVGQDGRLVLPVRRATSPETAFDLLENLEKLARFHHALTLDNPTSSLRGKVDLALERLADGGWVPARQEDGRTVFFEDEHLALKIVNRSGQGLHLYAAGFSLTGKVGLIYRSRGIRKSVSPERLAINIRLVQEWPLSVPWDFPFEEPGAPASGLEFVKLFATTEPVDFGLLCQASLSERGSGIAYRGSVPARTAKPQDWTTVTRSFVLHRRTRATW